MKFKGLLERIDYKISGSAYSRPLVYVAFIVKKLNHLNKNKKFSSVLDIGGGQEAQYKPLLKIVARRYLNLEIKKGRNVNIVGSVYNIALKSTSVHLATLFMVLEHLNDPLRGLQEVNRVLIKGGHVAITTVQYWHTHNHPQDYFRYTRQGLEYLCKKAGFKVVDIWSIGGPFLVVFHAIELNLQGAWRTIFSIFFYRPFDWLDWIVFKHNDTRKNSDSVGWVLIAKKI
jgi:SAM-dependent methyltransferase